jgi:Holliday junction resolvasome RuvABC endonuclease subunit
MTAPERMDLICDRVLELLELHKPEVMGYENQAGVEAGKAKLMLEDPTKVHSNASSRRVHEVVGALRCAARIHRLPCYEVAPATVKVSLLGKGGGRGSKAQVKQAVSRMLGVSCSEHAADALAVAVATGRRHAIELAKQRAALGLIS